MNDPHHLTGRSILVKVDGPNVFPQKKAKVKPLKLPKAKLGVVKTPKPFKAMAPAVFKPKQWS